MTETAEPYSPGRTTLEALGYPASPTSPASTKAFPDGGLWRVEIPSVEGPAAVAAVLEEAARLDVPVHRMSQGSGVTLHTDSEIREMVQLCAENQVELCLYARPGADWDIGGAQWSAAGGASTRSRGLGQLGAAVAEVQRGVELGVQSFLVSDEGLLWVLHQERAGGRIPAHVQFKASVMSAPTNPASFKVNELLGADTINAPSDFSVDQLAELRAASDATIDIYIEAPDNIGGFVRYHEAYEIVRRAAPVYLKFGLRNTPNVYPAGRQLSQSILESTRERVRRARIGLDELQRGPTALRMSPLGSRDQLPLERFPAGE